MTSTIDATTERVKSVERPKSVEQLLDDQTLDLTELENGGNGWDDFNKFIDLR